MSGKTISAEQFDRKFDDGEDIDDYVDWSKARRPGLEARRVNVDCPAHMVEKLDHEAQRCGVARQALIKMWLMDRLDAIDERHGATRPATTDNAAAVDPAGATLDQAA